MKKPRPRARTFVAPRMIFLCLAAQEESKEGAWWIFSVLFQERIPESCGINDVGSATLLQVGGAGWTRWSWRSLPTLCSQDFSFIEYFQHVHSDLRRLFVFFLGISWTKPPVHVLDHGLFRWSWSPSGNPDISCSIRSPAQGIHPWKHQAHCAWSTERPAGGQQLHESWSKVTIPAGFSETWKCWRNAWNLHFLPRHTFCMEKGVWMEKEWTFRETCCRNGLCRKGRDWAWLNILHFNKLEFGKSHHNEGSRRQMGSAGTREKSISLITFLLFSCIYQILSISAEYQHCEQQHSFCMCDF